MSLYAGDVGPKRVRVTLAGPAELDLSTVASVLGTVAKPAGYSSPWAFSIESSAAQQLVVSHTLSADGGDLPEGGSYRLVLRLTWPGDVVRFSDPITFTVLERR